jgi:hypothetical protein
MFMSRARKEEIARYDARVTGGRNHDMGRGKGNGRDVINLAPQTTTPNTPSDEEDISLFTPDTRETKKPSVFIYCGQILHGVRMYHEEGDTIQFKYDQALTNLIALVETQKKDGWKWDEKYACNKHVEGIFFEVNIPKKSEGPTKFGDAAKGLATPTAATNEKTREGDGLSNDSLNQEEEKREDAGRDAPKALTKKYRDIRYEGNGRNLEDVNETEQNVLTSFIGREHVKGEFTLPRKLAEAPRGIPTMDSEILGKVERVARNRTVRDKSQDVCYTPQDGEQPRTWAEAAGAATGALAKCQRYDEAEAAQIQACKTGRGCTAI